MSRCLDKVVDNWRSFRAEEEDMVDSNSDIVVAAAVVVA